jgi:nucleoside-diphosphate-sugar epimerase
MKILVTGGAGYIGSVLIPILLEKNFHLTVLDNFLFKQSFLFKHNNLKLINGDVRNKELMSNILKTNFDYIIPLAALVGAPLCEQRPDETREVNEYAVDYLCKNTNISTKIIIPTSNSGYGIGEKNVYCTEESPLNPISIYGVTKVNAEKLIISRGNSISLRLATVFGISERMRLDLLVNHFVYKALKYKKIEIFEGDFKRNYVSVRDVARVFLFCIENFEKLKNNIYNFGLDNVNLTKIELAKKIKEQISNFDYFLNNNQQDPDKRDYIVSNKKILKTGFKFENSIESGIKELIDKSIDKLDYSKCSNIN